MNYYDVVIIGGGPAGIYTAINADRNKKIAILDKADRIGKKILVTGNGKCNITNFNCDMQYYNTSLVKQYLDRYNSKQTIQDFENMGLNLYKDSEGRMYPMSNSANSVLDILLERLKDKKNIDVFTSTNIKSININDNSYIINTDKGEFKSTKVVVAIGSTGSDNLLQMLGVKYNAFNPSLVSLKTTKQKGLGGVRISNVEVYYNNTFSERGEVLFKEDGISGIVIFNLSSIFARANIKNDSFYIDLLPDYDNARLEKIIKNTIKNNPNYSIIVMLEGLLHKAMVKHILDRLGLKDKSIKLLTKDEIIKIVLLIKHFDIKFNGFSDNNQVNTGGVSLQHLDKNLMYKGINNLYFVGEVVDVDGVCGGYNLQWAWTSGKIVGDNL